MLCLTFRLGRLSGGIYMEVPDTVAGTPGFPGSVTRWQPPCGRMSRQR